MVGSAICAGNASSICGPTAFTRTCVWTTNGSVYWSSSARSRTAASNYWRCGTAFAKANCRGGSCSKTCNGVGSSRRRSWRWATARWAFGRPCARFFRPPGNNVVGCIRRPTCWTSCRRACRAKAKQALHDIYLAANRADAEEAFDDFDTLYRKKFPRAVECLRKDRKELLTFYDFPAEHWVHLRTTNPIESTFATIRLRQRRTKGCGSREASLTMAFMLARQAERHWRRLNGSEVMVHVLEGKKFKDGVMLQDNAA